MTDIVTYFWDSVYLGNIFGVTNIPTVKAEESFDPKADAEAIKNAMKGEGADEKAIIAIITRRPSSQRQAIKTAFKELYNKDLVTELKDDLGGNLEDVIVAMLTPIYDFLAQELHHAVDGIGTDEADLVEIICSASNEDLKQIKASYTKLFGKPLEKAIKGDTSGDFRKLLLSVLQADRYEGSSVDVESAQKDAKALLQAGALKLGTDEATFTQILTKRSYIQLKEIIASYKDLAGRPLIEDIEKEFSGDTKAGLVAIITSTLNKPKFFAERLNKIIAGVGTADRDLIRILVTRSEIDLGNIKAEYQKLYGKSLETVVADEVSGDYKKVLLGLLDD